MFREIRSTTHRDLQKERFNDCILVNQFNKCFNQSVQRLFEFRKCIIGFAVWLKEHCKSPIELSKSVVEFDKWVVAFAQQVVDFDKCVIAFAQLAAPLDKLNGRYNKCGCQGSHGPVAVYTDQNFTRRDV